MIGKSVKLELLGGRDNCSAQHLVPVRVSMWASVQILVVAHAPIGSVHPFLNKVLALPELLAELPWAGLHEANGLVCMKRIRPTKQTNKTKK